MYKVPTRWQKRRARNRAGMKENEIPLLKKLRWARRDKTETLDIMWFWSDYRREDRTDTLPGKGLRHLHRGAEGTGERKRKEKACLAVGTTWAEPPLRSSAWQRVTALLCLTHQRESPGSQRQPYSCRRFMGKPRLFISKHSTNVYWAAGPY